MKKTKALLDFNKFSVAEKISFFRNVIDKLTNNPFFPNPDIPLTELKVLVDDLEAAMLATKDGSHTSVSAMHDKEKITDQNFHIMANYVDKIAQGDETQVLSSGFHASKQPTPRQKPILEAIKGLRSGSLKLIARAILDARSYKWQIAKDKLPLTEAEWETLGINAYASYEVEGLTPGCKYYIRMAAITSAGITDYCAPIEVWVV